MPFGEARGNRLRERAKKGNTSGLSRTGTTLEVNGIIQQREKNKRVFFTLARTREAVLPREAAERMRCSFVAEGKSIF